MSSAALSFGRFRCAPNAFSVKAFSHPAARGRRVVDPGFGPGWTRGHSRSAWLLPLVGFEPFPDGLGGWEIFLTF